MKGYSPGDSPQLAAEGIEDQLLFLLPTVQPWVYSEGMFSLEGPTHLVLRRQEGRFSCSTANKGQKSRQGQRHPVQQAGSPADADERTSFFRVFGELGRQLGTQQASSTWFPLYLWCLMRVL